MSLPRMRTCRAVGKSAKTALMCGFDRNSYTVCGALVGTVSKNKDDLFADVNSHGSKHNACDRCRVGRKELYDMVDCALKPLSQTSDGSVT